MNKISSIGGVSFSTSKKTDGNMGGPLDQNEETRKNRKNFLNDILKSVDLNQGVGAQLVHGTNVEVVSKKDAGKVMPECDGLITADENIPLFITTQDCAPIFITDGASIIACLHAGWRGVLAGILSVALDKIKRDFKIPPRNLTITIGPHIGPCHFEIQKDVASKFFNAYPEALISKNGKIFADLSLALRDQALKCAVPLSNVNLVNECTFCVKKNGQLKYFSWRRDQEKLRLLSAIIRF